MYIHTSVDQQQHHPWMSNLATGEAVTHIYDNRSRTDNDRGQHALINQPQRDDQQPTRDDQQPTRDVQQPTHETTATIVGMLLMQAFQHEIPRPLCSLATTPPLTFRNDSDCGAALYRSPYWGSPVTHTPRFQPHWGGYDVEPGRTDCPSGAAYWADECSSHGQSGAGAHGTQLQDKMAVEVRKRRGAACASSGRRPLASLSLCDKCRQIL